MQTKPKIRKPLGTTVAGLTQIMYAEIRSVADPIHAKIELGASIPQTFTVEWVNIDDPVARHSLPDHFALAPTPHDIVILGLVGMIMQIVLLVILCVSLWTSVWTVLCTRRVSAPFRFCSSRSNKQLRSSGAYRRVGGENGGRPRRGTNLPVNNIIDLTHLPNIRSILNPPPKPVALSFLNGVGGTSFCLILTLLILAANGQLFRVKPKSVLILEATVWLLGTAVGGVFSVVVYSLWSGGSHRERIDMVTCAKIIGLHATVVPLCAYLSTLAINVLSGIPTSAGLVIESFAIVTCGMIGAGFMGLVGVMCTGFVCVCFESSDDEDFDDGFISMGGGGVYTDSIPMQNMRAEEDVGAGASVPHFDTEDEEQNGYEYEEVWVEIPLRRGEQEEQQEEETDEGAAGTGAFDTNVQPRVDPEPSNLYGTDDAYVFGCFQYSNFSLHFIQLLGVLVFLSLSSPTILATCQMQFSLNYAPVPGTLVTAWILVSINFVFFVSFVAFQWVRRNVMWWHWVPFTMGYLMTTLVTLIVVIFVAHEGKGSMQFTDFGVLVIRLFNAGSLLTCTLSVIASVPLSILMRTVHNFTHIKASKIN
jgi:hypothetical protein